MPIELIEGRKVHYQVLSFYSPPSSPPSSTPISSSLHSDLLASAKKGQETAIDHQCTSLQKGSLKVVCLHGLLLGNLASWYLPVLSWLNGIKKTEKTHLEEEDLKHLEFLFYDLRGHGKSEWTPNGYDVHTLVNDLSSLLTHLNWHQQQVVLVGHSYGGWIAFQFARLFPQHVFALGLVDTPFPPFKTHPLSGFLDQLTQHLSSSDSTSNSTSPLHLANESSSPPLPTLDDLINHLPLPLQKNFQGGGRRGRKKLEMWFKLLFQSTFLEDLHQTPPLEWDHISPSSFTHEPWWCVYGTESPCIDDLKDLQNSSIPSTQFNLYLIQSGHFILDENPDLLMRMWSQWLKMLLTQRK